MGRRRFCITGCDYHVKNYQDRNKILTIQIVIVVLFFALPPFVNAFDNKRSIYLPGPSSGEPVHETITRQALSFLKPDSLEEIVRGNINVDVNNAYTPESHFDNCTFEMSVIRINCLYRNIAKGYSLDLSAFGEILHTVQDFYSHTNWVDLGNKDILVDNKLGFWSEVNSELYGNLVSGVIGKNFPMLCPSGTISHGELNKDTIDRKMFQEARNLAVKQTTHEWCRLRQLVWTWYGQKGLDRLNAFEVDSNMASEACKQKAPTQTPKSKELKSIPPK